ncbi:MAG: hypothetical protein H7067_09550, partial [Burkholderiales bacterium]|nr:hypothetical protein [Opitutaceae bacterium]
SYQIEIDPEAAWTLSEADEAAQQEANGRAMTAFMERLADAVPADDDFADADDTDWDDDDDDEPDDDAPTSTAEATADAEQARMDLLLDRIQARIARALEAGEEPDHAAIMDEERARLRRERGEPEPTPPTPEQEAEQSARIDAMNAAAEEALAEMEADEWKDDEDEDRDHPLVLRCRQLTERILADTRDRRWLADTDPQEHPLRELLNGVIIASGKLAGALNSLDDEDEWPPDPLFAGDTLVRLKKARGHLRDALAGADAAAEQSLADATWLAHLRAELVKLLAEVETLVTEVRSVLEKTDEDES